jgi:hypothetical protein
MLPVYTGAPRPRMAERVGQSANRDLWQALTQVLNELTV